MRLRERVKHERAVRTTVGTFIAFHNNIASSISGFDRQVSFKGGVPEASRDGMGCILDLAGDASAVNLFQIIRSFHPNDVGHAPQRSPKSRDKWTARNLSPFLSLQDRSCILLRTLAAHLSRSSLLTGFGNLYPAIKRSR